MSSSSDLDGLNRTRWTSMRSKSKLLLLLLTVPVVPLIGGCASTSTYTYSVGSYLGDRLMDFGDIVTLTVGEGFGAKAQAGPLQVGLGCNVDFLGFRGGFGMPYYPFEIHGGPLDFALLAWGDQEFLVDGVRATRGKTFTAHYAFPFILLPERGNEDKIPLYYYSQLEVWAGVGIPPSLRIGVNPLEAVDFLAGWTTLDFMGDDIYLANTRPGPRPEQEKEPVSPDVIPGSTEDVSTNRDCIEPPAPK